MTNARTVGIVGLGAMGGAFARLLLSRGFSVVGHDVDAERAAALAALGGRVLGSVAEVRRAAGVVVTSLPSGAALAAVAGELATADAGAGLVVETSTTSLADKRAAQAVLAAAGVALLDCPVSGSADQAAAGDVIVLASGDLDDLDRADDVLRAMSRDRHRVGAFGAGTRVKLAANQLVIVHVAAAAEALRLIDAEGVDVGAALTALADGAGASRQLVERGRRMVDRDHESLTRLAVLLKDTGLIDELGLTADVYGAARDLLRRTADAGYGEADPSAVAELLDPGSG